MGVGVVGNFDLRIWDGALAGKTEGMDGLVFPRSRDRGWALLGSRLVVRHAAECLVLDLVASVLADFDRWRNRIDLESMLEGHPTDG